MKQILGIISIILCLISTAFTEEFIIYRVSGGFDNTIKDYIVDTAQVNKTPSWEIDTKIPLDRGGVMSIVCSEYPNIEKEKITNISLTKVGHRTTTEGKQLEFNDKWFYSVSWYGKEGPQNAIVLLDGSVIKPQEKKNQSNNRAIE